MIIRNDIRTDEDYRSPSWNSSNKQTGDTGLLELK